MGGGGTGRGKPVGTASRKTEAVTLPQSASIFGADKSSPPLQKREPATAVL